MKKPFILKICLSKAICFCCFIQITIGFDKSVLGQSFKTNLPCSSFSMVIVTVDSSMDRKIIFRVDKSVDYKIRIVTPCISDTINLLDAAEQITLEPENTDGVTIKVGSLTEIIDGSNKKSNPKSSPIKKPKD